MKMKSYDTFRDWINDQSPKNQKTIKALRAFIHKTAPKLEEKVKWGNGCFVGQNNGVIYLYADKEWVQFGFFTGVTLSDPKKMLEGNSNYIRHIKVRSPADIDQVYFANLLKQAVKSEAASPNLPTKNEPLFKGLSSPALSALAAAKITTLAKLAKCTKSDLLALHGFGPGSLPIIQKILKAKNLTLKTEIAAKPKATPTKKAKATPTKKAKATPTKKAKATPTKKAKAKP